MNNNTDAPILPKTCRAMAFCGPDNSDRLELINLIRPEPSEANVLIEVERSGVAFGDIIRSTDTAIPIGSYPWVPGYDVSGTIIAVGSRAADEGWARGDRVTAFCTTGGYADCIEISTELIARLPDGLDFSSACAINLNYLTAWQLLFRIARLPRLLPVGGRPPVILVQSAAGGVGSALLELARLFSIKAYGSCSAGKMDLVRELGGIPLDRNQENPYALIQRDEAQGLDAVFESRGFLSARSSRRLLHRRGCVAVFGFLEHYHRGDFFKMLPFVAKSLGFFLPTARCRGSLYLIDPEKKNNWYREDLASLLHLASEGKISPLIHSEIPLEKANDAWNMLKSGAVRGKLLLSHG